MRRWSSLVGVPKTTMLSVVVFVLVLVFVCTSVAADESAKGLTTTTTTTTTTKLFHPDFREVLNQELNELLRSREEVLKSLRERRQKLEAQSNELEMILKQKQEKKKLQEQQQQQQQKKGGDKGDGGDDDGIQQRQRQSNNSADAPKVKGATKGGDTDHWPADRLDALEMSDAKAEKASLRKENDGVVGDEETVSNGTRWRDGGTAEGGEEAEDDDDAYELGELQSIENQLKMLYFREQQINESEVLLHNTLHHLETVMTADNFTSEFTLKVRLFPLSPLSLSLLHPSSLALAQKNNLLLLRCIPTSQHPINTLSLPPFRSYNFLPKHFLLLYQVVE